ncbi:MAG: ABC transporter permease subunit [Micromonosporaceae bacterium]|nr:ABC transporter permease subunit [Micromonosporaceae bacterium]
MKTRSSRQDVAEVPAEAVEHDGAARRAEMSRQLQADVDRSRRRQRAARYLGRLAIVVGMLALWNYSSGRLVDEFWVSSPGAVWERLSEWLIDGTILHHFAFTIRAMVFGLLIGTVSGITVGFILGMSRFLSDIFEPFILVVYGLPKIALAPLFILWFGIGIESKVILAAVIVFFLVFYNTYAGVHAVDRGLLDVVAIMGGGRSDRLRHVILPSCTAWIYTGLQLAVPYSLIGAIVGEIIASDRGLGYLLRRSSGTFDTPGTISALIVLAAIGLAFMALVRLSQKWTASWMRVQPAVGNAI